MPIVTAAHLSVILGLLHICQCDYCASKLGTCGLDGDKCTSDFTGLTAQELIDNATLLV